MLKCIAVLGTQEDLRKEYSTREDAIEYLHGERGKHFDPELLDVFFEADIGHNPPGD